MNLSKKANSKMHALCRNVAIVNECGCVLATLISMMYTLQIFLLVDTGRKLNVHKTFRRRPGHLLNVLCTFSLRPVSTELIRTNLKALAVFSCLFICYFVVVFNQGGRSTERLFRNSFI